MTSWSYLVYEPADTDLATEVETALDRAVPPEEDAKAVTTDAIAQVSEDVDLDASPSELADTDDDRYAPAKQGAVNTTRRYAGHDDTEIAYVAGGNLRFEWEDDDVEYKQVGGVGYPQKNGEDVTAFLSTIAESRDDYDTAVVVTANDTSDTAQALIYRSGDLIERVVEKHTPPEPVGVFGLVRAHVQREHDLVIPAHNALYAEEYHGGFETPTPLDDDTIDEWLNEAGGALAVE